MEKYYAKHLDKHFQKKNFGRDKEKKQCDPQIYQQARENVTQKLQKYLQESESMKEKLLSAEEQQFHSRSAVDESDNNNRSQVIPEPPMVQTITEQNILSVPCFLNIQQSECTRPETFNTQFQSIFHQFSVRNPKEEYGIVTYEIFYSKNDENKCTERSFLDLFIFIRTAQRKHKSSTMNQLVQMQRQYEQRIEVQRLSLFEEFLEVIQRDQEVTQEFGFFLQFENAHIWQKQFNLFLQSMLLDSFMIKSAFQHEEVEELLESEGIDLDMNGIHISNIHFKPKAQAKIEFIIQSREGRNMFQRRNISEFQKIALQIIKEKPITYEQSKNLKKFSEHKIEALKEELEQQVNMVLRYKGPCKFKDRLYKFLIG